MEDNDGHSTTEPALLPLPYDKVKEKQKQLACAICYANKRAVNPSINSSTIPKTAVYCSLCLSDDAVTRGILSAKTCVPVHDPLTRGHKRKRGDPYADCWLQHLREKHPQYVNMAMEDRCRSPTNLTSE